MKPTSLRQFAKRYGTVGLLLVGAYLLAWHLWNQRRGVLLASIAVLLASAYALNLYYHPCVVRGGHQLYLGRISPDAHVSLQPLEQRILRYWEEGSRTDKVRALTREFARSIEQQDRVRTGETGNQLCDLFRPLEYFKQDGRWRLHAIIGQIYLEQGWLDEAEHQFQSVLSAVPPGEPEWGKSFARKMAAYGLARSNALRGSYGTALQWLAQAPGEYNGGCGNANEAEAVGNYPMKVVWTAASKPLPVAVAELEDIMCGRFAPMESWLNGDTSEEQRQHAAIEACLTLGCLYKKAGKRVDAEACWTLVVSNAASQPEVAALARAMLGRLQHD